MKPIIYSAEAVLWDGARQLPGRLELGETEIRFLPATFRDSHLILVIPLLEISRVEEYLVFDLARNGLRIESRSGKTDLFVLEDVPAFRQALRQQIERLSK